jgi:hypothetical protein
MRVILPADLLYKKMLKVLQAEGKLF